MPCGSPRPRCWDRPPHGSSWPLARIRRAARLRAPNGPATWAEALRPGRHRSMFPTSVEREACLRIRPAYGPEAPRIMPLCSPRPTSPVRGALCVEAVRGANIEQGRRCGGADDHDARVSGEDIAIGPKSESRRVQRGRGRVTVCPRGGASNAGWPLEEPGCGLPSPALWVAAPAVLGASTAWRLVAGRCGRSQSGRRPPSRSASSVASRPSAAAMTSGEKPWRARRA